MGYAAPVPLRPASPRLALLALLAALVPASAPARPSLDDASDVEGFVAGFLEAELAERRVPGAVFVLVRGDRVALARGYGVANVETRAPVDPERTLFRVASVSKLFTATAALQLVEEGRLGLDDDVNRRLRSLRVPDAFGEPVRVRHLLTHTAGFDDRFLGIAALGADPPETLRAHLARRLPARALPPGRSASYSNYGVALLGLVVEDVAGRPFEEGVEASVLRPLGMTRSSFRPDAALRADLATGYLRRGDALRALPYDVLLGAPAGGLAATGSDMARFLRALLRGGALAGARVLRGETLAEMQRTQFSHDPALPGVGFGFHERRHGRYRAVEHAGDWGGFSSLLQLVPEADLGFFLSYNVDDPGLRERFSAALLARYLPVERGPAPPPAAGAEARAAGVAGWYRWNRYTRADLTKLFAPPVRVQAVGGGELRVGSPGSPFDALALREEAPGRYVAVAGDEAAVFRTDPAGRGRELFLAAYGIPFACERLAWWETPPALLGGLALFAAVLLSALVAWPLAAWRRRGAASAEPLARAATATALFAAAAWLACLALAVAALAGTAQLVHGPPPGLPAALALGVAAALATFPTLGFAILALARGWGSRLRRAHYLAVAGAALGLLLVFREWNWIGFRY